MLCIKMRFIGIILTFFLFFSLSACENHSGTNILDSALGTGKPYFAIQFNKSFAKRFSLPVFEAVMLSDNMQAIAVEINKANGLYTCELHLYVDGDIDIYRPVSGNYFFEKKMAEQFFIYGYNDADQIWNSDAITKNSMKIRFDSAEQVSEEYQFTRTLSYSRIHSSFLPGLTIVTLNTDCGMFERNRYPANIWIQKQNVGDYLVGNDGPGGVKQPEKNHKFPVPMQLIDQIQPYIEIAEQHNTERL